MFATTIAGSLPKPSWLAEPNKLWPQWRAQGDELAAAKSDATLLALKEQEDAGIDFVTDGEMSRQHFVHGFLEFVDGIDFAHKVEMGIRADRYKAMVPQVVGELKLKGRVHATEAKLARAHTTKKLKITMPGPMTIIDTIADRHYGDRVKMAMAFAGLLNQEARALAADGVDVIQFDEPAFNVYMDEAAGWGIEALHKAIEGVTCHHRRAHLLRLRHQGEHRLEGDARHRVAPVREGVSGAREVAHRAGLARVPQLASVPMELMRLLDGKQVQVGVIDVASDTVETAEDVAAVIGEAMKYVAKENILPSTNCGMAPMRRDMAVAKLKALGDGARLARKKYA